jgi:hypothetical protein
MPRTPTWKQIAAEKRRGADIMAEEAERRAKARAEEEVRLKAERLARERAELLFPDVLRQLNDIERDARSQPEHVTAFGLIASLADTLQGLVLQLTKP